MTDPSGAVLIGAGVRVANTATGSVNELKTNEKGDYVAPYLVPGPYKLEVQAAGFAKYERDGLQVDMGRRVEVDVTMTVGQSTESVLVTAEASQLETEAATRATLVESHQVADLPTSNGNPYMLLNLVPGASSARFDMRTGDRPFDPSFLISFAMDGTRANRNDLTLDGVPVTGTNGGGNNVIATWVPPTDTVAEFKVQTATFDAKGGQTEGGLVNFSLKSGTNSLHSALAYNYMGPELTANDWFANKTGQPNGNFTYNRWDATVSGPLVIPHVFNGRNNTFFMWGYEGWHTVSPRAELLTVPTDAEKQGDFSALLKINANYQIYDPATATLLSSGRVQRTPFIGNIVPASRISPIAKNILSYFSAQPTDFSHPDGASNLNLPNEEEPLTYYTHTARVDHNFKNTNRLFGRFIVYKRQSHYFDHFNSAASGEWFQFLSRGAMIDDVQTFSPSFVMNLRIGFNRFVRVQNSNPLSVGFDLSKLGFPSSYTKLIDPGVLRFPAINIDGMSGSYNAGQFRPAETRSFQANFSKLKGAHNIEFGLEWREYREQYYGNTPAQAGTFNFSTNWTKGPLDNSTAAPSGGIGQGLASLLLGLPTGGSVAKNANYAEASTVWAPYIQDTWKASRKLTLTLGLRYELEGPLTERYDRSVKGFIYNAPQPIQAAVQAAYAKNPTPEVAPANFLVQGGLTFANTNGEPRTLWNRAPYDFMPRFGFAYQANEKTVVRGGYGIYYGFLGTRRTAVNQTGFSQGTNMVTSTDNGLTFTGTLANPFPNGLLSPTGASLGTLTNLGAGISFFNQNPKTPYNQKWSIGIQRKLPFKSMIDISYVGNRGTRIETGRNLNALPNKYLSTSPSRDQNQINYLSTNMPNPFQGLLPAYSALNGMNTNSTVSRQSLLVPYPEYGSVSTTTNQGYSWYHAMDLRWERQFANGFMLQVTETWSKFMEATGFLNGADLLPYRDISDEDIPHRLVVNWVYALPIGRGKALLGSTNRLVDGVIGGWKIAGIFSRQSGEPLGFPASAIFYGDINSIVLPASQRTWYRWFNTNAGWETNNTKALGSSLVTTIPRNSWLRSDILVEWDIAGSKEFRFKDRYTVQVRGDFLNAFNQHSFATPDMSPYDGANFGTISTLRSQPRKINLTAKFTF